EVLRFLLFPGFKPVFIAFIAVQRAGSAGFSWPSHHHGDNRSSPMRRGNICFADGTDALDNQVVAVIEAKPFGGSIRLPVPAPKSWIHFPQNLAIDHLAAFVQAVPTRIELIEVHSLPPHVL